MPETYPKDQSLLEEIRSFIGKGEGDFDMLAKRLFHFQCEENAPYVRFCQSRGVDSPTSWRDFPAVPTRAFKLPNHPLTVSQGRLAATFLTSGTTGETRGAHHLAALDFYHLALREALDKSGLPQLTKRLFLAPSPAEAPSSSLSHMFGELAAEESDFLLCEGRFDLARLYQVQSPVFLMGTALAFLHLMESHGPIALPPGSHLMETGGYKGSQRTLEKEELYRQLAQFFDLTTDQIHNEYGMTELSSQAYATGADGTHRFPAWCRILTVCPQTGAPLEPGEAGYLRIVDLANVYSIATIQTQDLAVVHPDDSFSLLGRDPAALPRGCSRRADEELTRIETVTTTSASTTTAKTPPPLELIVRHAEVFAPWTGEFDLAALQQWRQRELPDTAVIPPNVVHIVSGNTPHSAWQSLLNGLVLGSHNRVKLPAQGLDDFETKIPPDLRAWVETSRVLPAYWIPQAGAIVVYGNDATIRHFREQAPLEVPFVGHGHRVGVAIIEEANAEAAELAAQDICEYDQAGCLSLQTIFVDDAKTFAPLLAAALDARSNGVGPTPGHLREEIDYLAAQEPETYCLWTGSDWTLIINKSPDLSLSPGMRTVFLKPRCQFRPEPWLSGVGLYPFPKNGPDLPAPRIFPLGQAQSPPFAWAHDGWLPLASLIRHRTHQSITSF